MKEIILEIVICALAASLLMIIHELTKALVYLGIQKKEGSKRKFHGVWALYRYLDPVGVILSVTSSVAFSRPFMFRIQNKKTNFILGITGFLVLLLCFSGSMYAIHSQVLGVRGMYTLVGHGFWRKCVTLFIQYIAIISAGMFLANLFPVSTFDMGLVIAGISPEKYLNIIKMDAVIKVIFILAVLLNLIHYGSYRFIQFLL